MPADPGKDLGKEKIKTRARDIGHVAPSFEDKPLFNTLAIRPTYRISLKLGDIENLFPWPINTKAGRLARMQVLGLFYWPLNHRVAAGTDPANNRKPAGDRMADNQSAYTESWKYFKEKFCGVAKATLDADATAEDAKGEDELKNRLKEWIVQKCDGTEAGSSYKTDGETTGGGVLPMPADEDDDGQPTGIDETQGHFAKIRMPGGWRFLSGYASLNPNKDNDPAIQAMGTGMYDSMYDFENACAQLNPVLGKIPLIAKVEKLVPSTNEWKPAENAWVYFQLVKPYDLPAFDENRKTHQQLNRPNLIGSVYSVTDPTPKCRDADQGPKYFMEEVWDKYQYDPNIENPLVNNCHVDCGGKRRTGLQTDGSDVADAIFKTGDVEGFSKEHVAPPDTILDEQSGLKRDLDEAPSLKPVHAVSDPKYPHAVKTQTNDKGEAGVVFAPARCAGDRYRIRAFVGHNTVKGPGSDGKGKAGVRVDTGTFVVWRNIRLSRFITQKIAEGDLHSTLVNDCKRFFSSALPEAQVRDWMEKNKLTLKDKTSGDWLGLPALGLDNITDGNWKKPPPAGSAAAAGSEEDGLRVAFAKGFCEFETDPGYKEDLTTREWNAAVQCGVEDIQDKEGNAPYGINLDKMLYRNNASIWSDVNKVGVLVPVRDPKAYRADGGSFHNNYTNRFTGQIQNKLIEDYIYNGMMRHFTRNASLPGITVVQAGALTNVEYVNHWGFLFGIGTELGGPFVVKGMGAYAQKIGHLPGTGYGYTACVAHEIGHVIFKVHAPGIDPGGSPAAGTKSDRHDSHGSLTSTAVDSAGNPRGEPNHGTCLMSYRDCEGFFCSRCLLQLRGWDILANAVKNNTSSPLSIANLTVTPRYSTLPRQIAFAVTGGGGSGTYTYRWDFGDGTPASNTRNPNHNYTTADIRTATVWVSDSADPGNTVSRTLKITPPVDFTDYTASTINAPRGTEITFRVNGATGGAGNYQYEWNFGDGDTRKRNRAQCKHTYANAGTYTVVIDVKDSEDVDNHKTENTLRVTITA